MIDFCKYKWTMAMENGRLIHPDYPYMWYDCDAVYVRSGMAELSVYIEPNTIHHWDGKTYTPAVACGLLRSVNTFGYGTFSARIMLPKGRNLWPAFWLVGEGKWPKGGEIDIMEAWSDKCGSYFRATIPQPPYLVPSWDTTTNVHWEEIGNLLGVPDGEHKSVGSRRLPMLFSLKRPAHNFVKYEVEWRQDVINFRVNGKTIRTYGYHIAKHLHDKKMHVIFDLWTTKDDFSCISPMKIRNFEYKPIEIL